jgi:hypothetical protein
MIMTSPRGVLIVNPLSTLLGHFPNFAIILLATNECVAIGSINEFTSNEFNYKVPATLGLSPCAQGRPLFGEAMTSSYIIWNTLPWVLSPCTLGQPLFPMAPDYAGLLDLSTVTYCCWIWVCCLCPYMNLAIHGQSLRMCPYPPQ